MRVMNAEDRPAGSLRIMFFGLSAGVSAVILSGLLADEVQVVGVVMPAAAVPHLLPDQKAPLNYLEPHLSAELPVTGSHRTSNTLGVAWAAGLPVLAVRDFEHPDSIASLRALNADVACVACFTRRIPAVILRLPRLGFLNLHSSLLPAYRGPVPVFWQLRDGAPTGVTVHFMDEGLDTGDVVAQASVSLPDGITGSEAEQILMLSGLDLLRGVLRDLAGGTIQRWPQPPGGNFFGFPRAEDFSLSAGWPARRAFNFIRGTADRGQPYSIEISGQTVWLATADNYTIDAELDRPSVRHGRSILIRFNPGILYARMVR